MQLQVHPDGSAAALLDLDWDKPLAAWVDPRLVRMARAPARHLVRFVELGGRVYALKEMTDRFVRREHNLLREMTDAGLPTVEAVATVCDRRDPNGEPLDGILVTRYLNFSLPFTYLLAQENSVDQQHRLIDAAAVLLVALHLEGFFWGDCSLANMLFRRDAGALAAYLVDSETAEHHESLTDRQRAYDVDLAVENLAGGVEDLLAAGRIDPVTDAAVFATRLETRYGELWSELTAEEVFAAEETWRVEERVRRLNALGFDVAELLVRSDSGAEQIRLCPSVVEEGHHTRRLARLTGIAAQENQARRLLNDLGSHRARLDAEQARRGRPPVSEAVAAYRWLTDRFEPFIDAIPTALAARLEPAEAYHQYLDHRWYLSETVGRSVPDEVALPSFFEGVLASRPEERVVLPEETGELAAVPPNPDA